METNKGINGLFSQLLAIFGNELVDVIGVTPSDEIKQSWVASLKGLTKVEFDRGLQECRDGLHFCPKSPGEFKKICEQGAEQLPNAASARKGIAYAFEKLGQLSSEPRRESSADARFKALASPYLKCHLMNLRKPITHELIDEHEKRRDELMAMNDITAHGLANGLDLYMRARYLTETMAIERMGRLATETYEKQEVKKREEKYKKDKTTTAKIYTNNHWSE